MKATSTSAKKLSLLSLFFLIALSSAISFSNIVFTEFRAVQEESTIHLNWTTASEQDLMDFSIERSNDAVSFLELSHTHPIGNSDVENHYDFMDMAPFFGTAYYRVKCLDINGVVSYSDLISIEFEADSDDLILYPNPGDGRKVEINFFTKKHQVATITMINSVGAITFQHSLITESHGSNCFCLIPYDQLIKGVYFIVVEVNGEKRQQKLIVY